MFCYCCSSLDESHFAIKLTSIHLHVAHPADIIGLKGDMAKTVPSLPKNIQMMQDDSTFQGVLSETRRVDWIKIDWDKDWVSSWEDKDGMKEPLMNVQN